MHNTIKQTLRLGLGAAALLLAVHFAFLPPWALTLDPDAGIWAQIAKFSASDGAEGDWLGFSVAFDGSVAVIGAPKSDLNGEDSGVVYLYEKQNGWRDMEETARLIPSDGEEQDAFGSSVAISGDTIVVGAPLDDDNGNGSGSAYVFVKPDEGWTTITETAKLQPMEGAEGDWFGEAVDIDGGTIISGAPRLGAIEDGAPGAVFLFDMPAEGWSDQHETAVLTASDGEAWAGFGFSAALDGDTIVAGVPFDDEVGKNSGSAYVFTKPDGGWTTITETAKLLPLEGAAYDWFGRSVAVFGNTITVGAPQNDRIASNSGAAYLFEKPADSWVDMNETALLIPTDGQKSDLYGWSVAADANLAVVSALTDAGSEETGRVYLFDEPNAGWTTITETLILISDDAAPLDRFGIAIASSGRSLVVGADSDDDKGINSGSAYIFSETGSIEIIKETMPQGGDGFTFSHNINGSEEQFSLDDTQSQIFERVTCGTYRVTEEDPSPQYDLSNLECFDSDGKGINSSVDIDGRTASINLDAGEKVTCRFVNDARGEISVVKSTVPMADPQVFPFHLSGGPDFIDQGFSLADGDEPHASGYLKAGDYAVREDVLDGWVINSAACSDGSAPDQISLEPGELITCSFGNLKLGRIFVEKETTPTNNPQPFEFLLEGGPDAITDNFELSAQDEPYASKYLMPGFYTLIESMPPYWENLSANCDNGFEPNSIRLKAGEVVNCTFSNQFTRQFNFLPLTIGKS